ncbi:hypothetical protein ABW20_dc0103721 [Dactylellina cionopaga]|nr:hypothetical protein ABW20_dc0103721 [Dactylellina cionopaga]
MSTTPSHRPESSRSSSSSSTTSFLVDPPSTSPSVSLSASSTPPSLGAGLTKVGSKSLQKSSRFANFSHLSRTQTSELHSPTSPPSPSDWDSQPSLSRLSSAQSRNISVSGRLAQASLPSCERSLSEPLGPGKSIEGGEERSRLQRGQSPRSSSLRDSPEPASSLPIVPSNEEEQGYYTGDDYDPHSTAGPFAAISDDDDINSPYPKTYSENGLSNIHTTRVKGGGSAVPASPLSPSPRNSISYPTRLNLNLSLPSTSSSSQSSTRHPLTQSVPLQSSSYPLSPAQQSIWFAEQRMPAHPQFNLTLVYQWSEAVAVASRASSPSPRASMGKLLLHEENRNQDLKPHPSSFCWACFRHAALTLLSMHDSLRATFPASTACTATVHPLTVPDLLTFHTTSERWPHADETAPTLPRQAFSSLFHHLDERSATAAEITLQQKQLLHTGFDVENNLPIRFVFISQHSPTPEQQPQHPNLYHQLHIIAHHLAADGYSMTQLIHTQLWYLYAHAHSAMHVNEGTIRSSVIASTPQLTNAPSFYYATDFTRHKIALRERVAAALSSTENSPPTGDSEVVAFINSLNYHAGYYSDPQYSNSSEIKFPPLVQVAHPQFTLSPSPTTSAICSSIKSLPNIGSTLQLPATSMAALSSMHTSTDFNLLFSLTWLLLARYTGKNCFGINIALLNRPRPLNAEQSKEWLKVVGEFASSMPVIINASDLNTLSMNDLIATVTKSVNGVKKHEQVSLNDLHILDNKIGSAVHRLPNRSRVTLSAIPALSTNNEPFTSSLPANVQASFIAYGDSDLNLYWFKEKSQLVWSYSTAALSPSTVQQMQENMLTLIDSLVQHGLDQPLGSYFWVHPKQVKHLMERFHTRTEAKTFEQTLHGLVERTVERMGEEESQKRVAIIDRERELSYSELTKRSLALAILLQQSPVSIRPNSNQTVAILVDRSLTCLISLLSVMQAGATYLPLDCRFPMERLYYMLKDVRVDLILCCPSGPCVKLFEELGTTVRERGEMNWNAWLLNDEGGVKSMAKTNLSGEQCSELFSTDVSSLLPLAVSPLTVAFLIYTSGTTGNPKAVRVRHGGISNAISGIQEFFKFGPSDRLLQSVSMCFDVHIPQCFGPWAHGSTVVLLNDEIGIAQSVKKYGVTMIEFVPSVLDTLRYDSDEYDSVRFVQAMGEACPLKIAKAWSTRYAVMTNGYGPAEISVYSHIAPIQPSNTRLLVGRPLPNTYSYILDEELRPVPIGVTGLLYIGGYGCADGYHGLPELSSAKFIPDPFHPSFGYGVMYNSGDLCRWAANGQLECVGRIDHQVKWRGMRIELPEIEECILSADKQLKAEDPSRGKFQIDQAAVILHEPVAGEGEPFLAAFVSPTSVDVPALRKYMSLHLPYWMVPSSFSLMARLALSTNGKLDRKQLPTPTPPQNVASVADAALAPKNPTNLLSTLHSPSPSLSFTQSTSGLRISIREIEKQLSSIWNEVLGYPVLNTDVSFFDAGGHSLSLMKLADKIRRSFDYSEGAAIPKVGDLFVHTTLRAQAQLIWQQVECRDIHPTTTLPSSRYHTVRRPTPITTPKLTPPHSSMSINTPPSRHQSKPVGDLDDSIAIVGMDGIFPSAANIEEFWSLLIRGEDGVRALSEAELKLAGISQSVYQDKRYVNASGRLSDVDLFDAEFFSLSVREAMEMDPQHRLLLERAYNALDDAAVNISQEGSSVGVFVAAADSEYLHHNLGHAYNNSQTSKAEKYRMRLGNSMGSAATRVAYTLNLQGPALSINTACSSGLVAVATAIDQIRLKRCKLALACATSVDAPQVGYLYEDGMIYSQQGRCKPFDSSADGIILGNAVCAMVLQPLKDAVKEGRSIYGVLRAVAINNNGHRQDQPHFAAPSIEGQVECIKSALEQSNLTGAEIGLVEGHGTGTRLGDVAEVKALAQVFGGVPRMDPIVLSSVKGNFGHTDIASGMVGLMKAVLAVQEGFLPATCHFKNGNTNIDWSSVPLQVRNQGTVWRSNHLSSTAFTGTTGGDIDVDMSAPARFALVTSLGMGGTNAIAIVQAPPAAVPKNGLRQKPSSSSTSSPPQLILLSAKTDKDLQAVKSRMVERIQTFNGKDNSDFNLSNISYTLAVGRTPHAHRFAVVVNSLDNLLCALSKQEATHRKDVDRVLLMFPGQGSIDRAMSRALYTTSPLFRQHWQLCNAVVIKHSFDLPQIDLTSLLLSANTVNVQEWEIFLPILTFIIEYCMAQLWLKVMEPPFIFLGHSVGEYVAAVCAGAISMEESLSLLCARTRVMTEHFTTNRVTAASSNGSKMVAIRCDAAAAEEIILDAREQNDEVVLSITGFNSPNQSVLAGDSKAIAWLSSHLSNKQIQYKELPLHIPYHSHLIPEAVVENFNQSMEYKSTMHTNSLSTRFPPTGDYALISTVTGKLVTSFEPMTADHWCKHMRQPVLFRQAVQTALKYEESVATSWCLCVEIGCGTTLANMVKYSSTPADLAQKVLIPLVVSSLPLSMQVKSRCSTTAPQETEMHARAALLMAMGQVWASTSNVSIDWKVLWQSMNVEHNPPLLLHLPTYPFDKKSFWVQYKPLQQLQPSQDQLETESITTPSTRTSSVQTVERVESIVSPEYSILSTILSILTEVIHVPAEGLDADQDFFSLGGDSFTSSIMLHRLKTRFKVELPMYALLGKTSMKALSLQILILRKEKESQTVSDVNRDATSATYATAATASTIPRNDMLFSPHFVILQAGEPQNCPPLFVIAPTGGTLFFYRDLVVSLPKQVPVYGIKYPEGNDEAESSVEALTRFYVNALLSFKMTSPYQLCGASFGGMLVYEMMQQLHRLKQARMAENQIVDGAMYDCSLVVMLDSPTLASLRFDSSAPSILALMFDEKFEITPAEVAALVKMQKDEMLSFVVKKEILPSKASRADSSRVCNGREYDPVEWQRLQTYMHIFESNLEIMCKYTPTRFQTSAIPGSAIPSSSTKILFLEPTQPRQHDPIASSRDWLPAVTGASGVEFVVGKTGGNHLTMMFQPNVGVAADLIKQRLASTK